MYCKKCGSALPSHGFICLNCGTMMDNKQISKQKEYMKESDNKVNLLSDKYDINKEIKERKENNFLGVIVIVLILIILVILVLIKVM